MSANESNAVVLARIDETVKGLKEDVADIKTKLYGNGKPGIIVDQEIQNAQIQDILKICEQNTKNIEKLSEASIPNWLQKKWFQILTTATLFFLILHSIIPADMSVWTLFMKWLHLG